MLAFLLARRELSHLWQDKTLTLLCMSWLLLLALGFSLWLEPQQQLLAEQTQQLQHAQSQLDELESLYQYADGDIAKYPTHLAKPDSDWTRIPHHQKTLYQEIATGSHPQDGPLHSLEIQPTPMEPGTAESPYPNESSYTLQASGSYAALGRVLRHLIVHQPFFRLVRTQIKRHPDLPGQYRLTVQYTLPLTSESARIP